MNSQLVNSIKSGWDLTSQLGSRGTLARFASRDEKYPACCLPFSVVFCNSRLRPSRQSKRRLCFTKHTLSILRSIHAPSLYPHAILPILWELLLHWETSDDVHQSVTPCKFNEIFHGLVLRGATFSVYPNDEISRLPFNGGRYRAWNFIPDQGMRVQTPNSINIWPTSTNPPIVGVANKNLPSQNCEIGMCRTY